MSRFLRENSLLISAPKSSVNLFTPDPAQANISPKIKIADSDLPFVRIPKILGVYLDTFFKFNNHYVQVANRVSKRNNVLNALAGTNWGQQKETLLMTYKALERSIANYAAPVWSTNASESNIGKLQRAQNGALMIITGSHKMSSIDHFHNESEMLQVEDHLNHLSAQYLVQCLDTKNVYQHITKMNHPPRKMKEKAFWITRGGTVRRHPTPANRDHHLSRQSVVHLSVFCASCQFAAAELIPITTTKPSRRRPDQTIHLLLQMSGDDHPNPGPAF